MTLDDVEFETDDRKHIFCSEGCLDEWLAENGEDDEEGGDDDEEA